MFFMVEKAEKYINNLKKYIYQEKKEISEFLFHQGDIADAEKGSYNDLNWDRFVVGDYWGGKDLIFWFRKELNIPSDWQDKKVVLYFELGDSNRLGLGGAESLLYINGEPVQGLDVNHQEVLLKKEFLRYNPLFIAIKAFSGLKGNDLSFKEAFIAKVNQETEDYYYRASTILKTIKILEKGSYDYENLLKFLNESINIIDFRRPGNGQFYATVKAANRYLKGRIQKYQEGSTKRPVVTTVGHSHIDVAWLWRIKHTREKCSRTFSTVLHLMDQYPEYQFVQSSPQLYEYIKEDYPQIYSKIKERIKSGHWEVTGGMWVEADCNIPSGESLIRQFLLGTRFFRKEFNKGCKILWLPDVFGYSWALPQIIKKSGLKYFMTIKISWNQFNCPEYDTFNWRGIDGTEVLTHFITNPARGGTHQYTYNGILDPESVKGTWDKYREKHINDNLLLSYGWGDGGGGPTKKMIETGKKMQELPGIPEVKFGLAEPYFKELEEKVKDNKNLPVWDGELYLEYHRGTFTSQARIKRNNRYSEVLYHNVELFASMAERLLDNYYYPLNKINQGWKTILCNQFHDILPGSSIKEVYEDSSKDFEYVFTSGNQILDNSLVQIAASIALEGEKLVVFNPLSWSRGGLMALPLEDGLEEKAILNEDGNPLNSWVFEDTTGIKKLMVKVPEIPSLGYQAFAISNKEQLNTYLQHKCLSVQKNEIENKYFKIKINDHGQITSIYDKEVDRQILPSGQKANVLQVFEDVPMKWDAWDIDIYYQEKEYTVDDLLELKVEERDAERAVIRFKWKILNSIIEQRMIVYADKRRIDFKTEVDWHEHQLLLKAAFPVDVRATKARYEIQFGSVERPTHWNTSWDYAKFETCAHKWVDLSEGDYGVSLLNDCKYGYDVKDQTIRLTLIKSGIMPDQEADQGYHEFTYSLFPHRGNWLEGETTKEAYQLNYPLLTVRSNSSGGKLPIKNSLVTMDSESTILETVKKAEDGSGLILRFYEYGNRRDRVKVTFNQKINKVVECNLIEEKIQDISNNQNSFIFEIKPFEIKTCKIV